MEAVVKGVKAGFANYDHPPLRAIPESLELSSLSSLPDGFRNTPLRNYRVAKALRRGTPLAIGTGGIVQVVNRRNTTSRYSMVRASALAALIATIGSTPASAQVRAVIHVNVGTPVVYAAPRAVVYAAPRPVIVRRVAAPSVIFVQRVPHRGRGWWKRNGYRQAIVYTDGRYYYNGWVQRPGVTQVTVYERDGRYLM